MPEIPLPENLFKILRPKAYEKRQTFMVLRETAIAQSKRDTAERIITNPQKTSFEHSLEVYIEELEPQVREAVIHLRELGYSTTNSGFWAHDYHQIIEMDNAIDPATQNTLRKMGVSVKEHWYWSDFHKRSFLDTSVGFRPETSDLEAIRTRWNSIAGVFPPSGQPLLDRPRWNILVEEILEQKKQGKQ